MDKFEKLGKIGDAAERMAKAKPAPRPRDRTCLSYWFPRIKAAGLPVPRTKILKFADARDTEQDFLQIFDCKKIGPKAVKFVARLESAIRKGFTLPVFLRTGQTSAKHDWERTCKISDLAKLQRHVLAIIEYSEACSFMGVPWDVWAVRPFMILQGTGDVLPLYGNMPVAVEWRVFVRESPHGFEVEHIQPYWPVNALVRGGMDKAAAEALLAAQLANGPPPGILAMSLEAAMACGGDWSVDWCREIGGDWILTDMAEAAKSYRWTPGLEKRE